MLEAGATLRTNGKGLTMVPGRGFSKACPAWLAYYAHTGSLLEPLGQRPRAWFTQRCAQTTQA